MHITLGFEMTHANSLYQVEHGAKSRAGWRKTAKARIRRLVWRSYCAGLLFLPMLLVSILADVPWWPWRLLLIPGCTGLWALGGLALARSALNVTPTLRVKRLTPTARIPTRGSERAIGLDLYADLPDGWTVIHPHQTLLIPTGIAPSIPSGYYGRVAPRSGVSLKGIALGAGVIDTDYRGEIGVVAHNVSTYPITIEHGMRVAQLIMERADILPVEEVDDLDATARGDAGFGSTGV